MNNFVQIFALIMEYQNPNSIIIMKPSNFGFNSDTAKDNTFQKKVDFDNPNIVKAACNINGDIMYFSRSKVPFFRASK